MKRKLSCFLVLLLSVFFLLSVPLASLSAESLHILSIKRIDPSLFPGVSVYFTLYDSEGIPVSALSKDSIELKENGANINDFSIKEIKNDTLPKYITLLIDNSGSMKGDALSEAKEAAKEFVASLNAIDMVKIYVFNDTPEVVSDFSNDKDNIASDIDLIKAVGSQTALNLAIYNAASDLEAKPSGQRAIVLLTDGKDEKASIAQDDAIQKAKAAKIPIYSVGFGAFFNKDSTKYDAASSQALSRFSILTGGVFFIASEQGDLAKSLVKVSDLLKNQYMLSYTSALPKDAKEYNLELMASVAGENLIDSGSFKTPTFEVTLNLSSVLPSQKVNQKTIIIPDIAITSPFSAKDEIKLVKYYLDTQINSVFESSAYPFSYELDPAQFAYGEHTLMIKAYDSLDRLYETSAKIVFPSPPIYKNPIFWGPIAAVILILAIVIPIVFVKRRKRIQNQPDYLYTDPELVPIDDISPIETIGDTSPGFPQEGFNRPEYEEEAYDGSSGTMLIDRNKLKPTSAAWLATIKGESLGKEYALEAKRRITIGRLTENDIVIDDKTVSKYHCFIVTEQDYFIIGDAGSSNGTYINEKKISSHKKLSDGDIITLGDTELEFKTVTFGPNKKESPVKVSPKPKKKTKGK